MTRTIAGARRLAAHVVQPSVSRLSIPRIQPSTSATSRYSCGFVENSNLRKAFKDHKTAQQRVSARQIVRYCSYRRAMYGKKADIQGGSVDVEASREVLPTNVKPLHYSLTVEPNFEKFSYEGTVVIEYVS